MRILIIEDEARIAKRIERMTRDFFGEKLQAVTACESAAEGIAFIQNSVVDVVLLDLNLNGEDGFELLKKITAESFHTIIVSAYTEKAITAFEIGVLDFVPKPFDDKRLAQAFLRISVADHKWDKGIKYLAVKKAGIIFLIDIADVRYIKGAGIYTKLHLQNNKREIYDKSL